MITNDILTFEGGSLQLLREKDVHDGYISGLNNPLVNRYLVDVRRTFQTTESVTQFVRHNLEDSNAILFGIWPDESRNHCGTVRLHHIDRYHFAAHVGICIFDTNRWGRGLGSKALRAMTRWGFANQLLRWIEAGIWAQNERSQNVFLAAGYEWVFDIDGKYLLDGSPAKVKVYAARNPKHVLRH